MCYDHTEINCAGTYIVLSKRTQQTSGRAYTSDEFINASIV